MPQPLSSVVDIRIFPEKDQPGVHLDAVVIETEGLVGDRRKKSPVHAIAQADAADTRANLVLTLDPERLLDLVGQTVSLGGARLTIVRQAGNCAGVYADVVTPGTVARGDQMYAEPVSDTPRSSPLVPPTQSVGPSSDTSP